MEIHDLEMVKEIIDKYERDEDTHKFGISNKLTDFENWIEKEIKELKEEPVPF